ncbi:MAG: prepilin-type N-terminal cleavage/methylation domain-containing protein [Candidatus Omnitrophota bacterium]
MTWLIGIKNTKLIIKKIFTPLKKYTHSNPESLTGFSLFELLVVVVIIGSLLAFNIPRFRSTFNNLKFDNFCQNLSHRMQYLQERASVEQTIYRLNFDINNRFINIETKEKDSSNFTSVLGFLARNIRIPDGFKIETSEQYVLFYPDGTLAGKDIEISAFENKAKIYIKETVGRIILLRNEKE